MAHSLTCISSIEERGAEAPFSCDCGAICTAAAHVPWTCPDCNESWDPIHPGDVLSPSKLRTFADCPARWRFKYIDRLPDPKTSSLALGIAVHEAIAIAMKHKADTGGDLPVAHAVHAFDVAWAHIQAVTEFRDEESPAEIGRQGALLVELFMRQAAPSIRALLVEHSVAGDIGGVHVQGRIDILDQDGRVIDVKTSQRKPGELEPNHVFQLTTYAALTMQSAGTARIITLVRTREPQIIQHSRTLTANDLAAIEQQYPLAQKAMRSGVYMPNRSSMLCSRRNCAFWRACEREHGGEVPLA